MAMQFNPNRIVAPSMSPNIGALLNARAGTGSAMKDLGLMLNQTGQDMRSQDVANLMASGELAGLTSDEANAKINALTQGDVGKQTQTNIADLISGKKTSEAANVANTRALEQLGLKIKSSEDIARENRIRTQEDAASQRNLQRDLNEANITSAEKISKANNLAKLLSTKKDFGTAPKEGVTKILEKGGAKEITQDLADEVSDQMDTFLDLDFDPKSKKIAQQAVTDYIATPEGQAKYGVGGIEAIINHLGEIGDFGTDFSFSQLLPFGRTANERTFKLKKK